jgi:ubiquinone/menaquinone biosynthesis C-methylase UbiE
MSRLAEFIQARAKETYPEPRSDGHDHITKTMLPVVVAQSPEGPVLDIGCGQGPALELLQEMKLEAIGITLNGDDLSACVEKGFNVELCDQNDMPNFWAQQFALVWARHVLEHSVAPFFTLHEFYRVLKTGGILYVEVPAPDTACCHHANANHYSVMGEQMWISLIQRSGFEILQGQNINLKTPAGPDQYFSFICRKP